MVTIFTRLIVILYLITPLYSYQSNATSDSLFIKALLHEENFNNETEIFINVKGETRYHVSLGITSMYYKIYKFHFEKNYVDFFSFMYDLVVQGVCLPEKMLRRVRYRKIKHTMISREEKRGINYLLAKYTTTKNSRIILKFKLKKDELNDFKRVMFDNKFLVLINEYSGELYFYKAK